MTGYWKVSPDLTNSSRGRLARGQADVHLDFGGLVVAPQVVLAVVGAAGVAAEGVAVQVGAADGFGDLGRVVDLDLDPGVLGPVGGELADGPADGLGAGRCRSARRSPARSLAGTPRLPASDAGIAEHRADQAGLVVGDAARRGTGCASRGRSRRCPWRPAWRPRSWRWPATRPSRSSRRSRSAGRPTPAAKPHGALPRPSP